MATGYLIWISTKYTNIILLKIAMDGKIEGGMEGGREIGRAHV